MERILPTTNIERCVQKHNLVYTDLRYSVGATGGVADVLQFEHDTSTGQGEVHRRLLLVDRSITGDQHELIWSVAATTERRFIIPRKIRGIQEPSVSAYQLPPSTRLLRNELLHAGAPKNLMGNEKIARSLGALLGAVHRATGDIVSFDGHLAIVDFVDEGAEPIILLPPVVTEQGSPSVYQLYIQESHSLDPADFMAFMDSFREIGRE